jgi:hypothetical protein
VGGSLSYAAAVEIDGVTSIETGKHDTTIESIAAALVDESGPQQDVRRIPL